MNYTRKELLAAHTDLVLSAKMAGVTYALDSTEGWKRVKSGKSFIYRDLKGKRIVDEKMLERVYSIRIPPAWKDVWISPRARGHLQATGLDIKGIKQYLYHPKWNAFRDALKYYRLNLFAAVLPELRKEIKKRLKDPEPTRERVIATALALIDELSIRVGNDGYAKENKTYGVTTLQNRHIDIDHDTITLHFIGKSHQEQEFELKNSRLAEVLQQEIEMPGARLFQYFDAEHHKHPLTSCEVNEFIKDMTNSDFTAKDFRTWSGTLEAYQLMKKACASLTEEDRTDKGYAKSMKEIMGCVAEKLGNTIAVCKAHYVHADLQQAFLKGTFERSMKRAVRAKRISGLSTSESELVLVLHSLYKEHLQKL
jgi:DNA topoisomerase-1